MKNRFAMPIIAIGYILVFIALQFAAQVVVTVVEMILHGSSDVALSAVDSIIVMAVFSLSVIALFAFAKWSPVSAAFVKSRQWMVVFWCVVASLGAIIPSAYLQELMPEWPASVQKYIDEISAQLMAMMNTTGGYAVICLLAPVAEEMVFRGAVLRKLLEWQPAHRWLMIVLSALLFALVHMNPAQLLHPFLIGILLGWIYMRTGSIVPGIIFHWANNTAAYLVTRIYQDPDVTVSQLFGESKVLIAVGFSLLMLIPAIYQLHLFMKRQS